MADNLIESFELSVSTVPSVYDMDTTTLYNSSSFHELDKVPHIVKHDFYKLGLTEELNKTRVGLDPRSKYFIQGQSKFDNKPRKSSVTLLTFDYKFIQNQITDPDGNYLFEFLLDKDYIIVAEDILCEYNHSIQVGVRPSETV